MRPPLVRRQRRIPRRIVLRQTVVQHRLQPDQGGGHDDDPASLDRTVCECARVPCAADQHDHGLQHEVRRWQVVQVQAHAVGGAEQPLVRREEVRGPVKEPARKDDPASRSSDDDHVDGGRGERASKEPGEVVGVGSHLRPAVPEPEKRFQPVGTIACEDERHHRHAGLTRLERKGDRDVADVHVSAGGEYASPPRRR